MTTERIKEIQSKTAYPESVSVQQALLQVWNEVEQEQLRLHGVSSCAHPFKQVVSGDEGMFCIECQKYI